MLIGAPALVLALSLSPTEQTARGEIRGSEHDFSSQGWASGEICLPCHTPHNADQSVTQAPLWNHAVTTASFTVYSSPTLQATVAQPGGSSKLCLSCHDGTVAIDSFGGTTGTTMVTGAANVGTDLSNDHPVSFTYDATLAASDGRLVDPAADGDTNPDTVGMSSPYVPLFAGKLECASCHDPHNGTSIEGLLRVSNAGSGLCLKCHDL
ncbi:MAG: cytochrome C [Deltaproteobacteria bacterium HGW-Deltaproteobacteria-14]|jgi:predicted CXXCH cytochrome family protein|nr:MAG: cytochrome C [Deltaproteobacteria bacterium HGW-Deltaproteobacteria-14]